MLCSIYVGATATGLKVNIQNPKQMKSPLAKNAVKPKTGNRSALQQQIQQHKGQQGQQKQAQRGQQGNNKRSV